MKLIFFSYQEFDFDIENIVDRKQIMKLHV